MNLDHPSLVKIDINSSVKAQASIRLMVGFPIILIMTLCAWIWAKHGKSNLIASGLVLTVHSIYIIVALIFSRRLRPMSASQIVIATAILDPLVLSAWLAILNEAGSLFVCFYLFTILGFGFRIGQKPMLICQLASLAGFSVVIAIAPIWHQHPLFAASFLSLLIVVPLYSKTLIKKLQDARAFAEVESSAKSELLAKVSHELRTPITGIMASAELLIAEARSTQNTQIPKRASTILALAKELLIEINDLLDSAKYKANALVLENALFDLHDVMDQLRLTLMTAAAAKKIELNITTDEAIEDLILGDAHYLSKVLTNIAGNAVKFTDNGNVDVNCELLADGGDHYRIRFGIRDTGIGIPSELHQKIFEPFVQASSGTTRQFGGTGLGMSIAKELVSLMGGEIKLESAPGKGSHFYFDLKFPKVVKEFAARPRLQEETLIVRAKSILVADDNETNLILIKELLELDGHTVTTVSNGMQTLDILNREIFDVIFLDYNMGDLGGEEVLQMYQMSNGDISPTFFLTADTTLATSEKLLNTGALGVLHKPITLDRIRYTLSTIFGDEVVREAPKKNVLPVKAVPSLYLNHEIIEELKLLSMRPDFLVDLLGNAIRDIGENSNSLYLAIMQEEIEKVREYAHALAGICASVGASRLGFMSRKVMSMTLTELRQEREKSATEIKETANSTVIEIREILNEATC
jgi:two-component system sensor histidine kinase RpfC